MILRRENIEQAFKSFQRGEEAGLTYFFNAYHRALCFFARQYVAQLSVAEDIVSEAFVRVWQKRAAIESPPGLKSYLYTTVYHACLSSLEQEQRRQAEEKAYARSRTHEEADILEPVIRAEALQAIHAAARQLPAGCHHVFVKLFVEGKTVQEAAGELGLSVSTVKTQKARAVRFLRQHLSPLCVAVIMAGLL